MAPACTRAATCIDHGRGEPVDSVADVVVVVIYKKRKDHSVAEVGQAIRIRAISFAICCALRLARFNAQIDVSEQPHKSLGFLTGVPAPLGAGLAFAPFYLWMATGVDDFRNPVFVGVWLVAIALLMISNMATPSWTSIRPRRGIRLEVLAFVGLLFAALLVEPWWTLSAICAGYLLLLPYTLFRYARIKRRG